MCVGGRTWKKGWDREQQHRQEGASPCQLWFWFGNPEEGYYTVVEEKEGH